MSTVVAGAYMYSDIYRILGAHVLMVSPANLDLKVSRLSALVASSGMLFQICVVSGKNECLAERVREYGTRLRVSSSPCCELGEVLV